MKKDIKEQKVTKDTKVFLVLKEIKETEEIKVMQDQKE